MQAWNGTKAPTYAAVVTEFDLDRWAGVPFVFVVGRVVASRAICGVLASRSRGVLRP